MTNHITEARKILESLGFPRAQTNERSALTLLALLDLSPSKPWSEATDPMMGITPIIKWVALNYQKEYAPNTRESFRKDTLHQFVQAGMVLYNPDKPDRSVNSGDAVYQIEPSALDLLRSFGSTDWGERLSAYLALRPALAAKYARERDMNRVPVKVASGKEITLSPGPHSELIRAIIEDFAPCFAPGSVLIYAGDTGSKWGYFDEPLLTSLGVKVDAHGKMPDVVLYYPERNWLLLVESVTSVGPVDGKRHEELTTLFAGSSAGLVYVTAFQDRGKIFKRFLPAIAWETEVWVADAPSHLIHFNGVRFLGPYPNQSAQSSAQ